MKARDYIFFMLHCMLGFGGQLLLAGTRVQDVYLMGYPYVLPLLFLPMFVSAGWLLIVAFVIGLLVDIMYGTLGVHMAAIVAMTYARSFVLMTFTPASLQLSQVYPSARTMGWVGYLLYLSILLFLHQFCIFSLEAGGLFYTGYHFSVFCASVGGTWLFFVLLELFRYVIFKKR